MILLLLHTFRKFSYSESVAFSLPSQRREIPESSKRDLAERSDSKKAVGVSKGVKLFYECDFSASGFNNTASEGVTFLTGLINKVWRLT